MTPLWHKIDTWCGSCNVADAFCFARGCLLAHPIGGQAVCLTQYKSGCPSPLSEPDPEKARCCHAPSFAVPRAGSSPRRQRCRNCGTWLKGARLVLARRLKPEWRESQCAHNGLRHETFALGSAWHCPSCECWWEQQPQPYDDGETLDEFSSRRIAAIRSGS